jgi:molybdate transport system substrate-binding protein
MRRQSILVLYLAGLLASGLSAQITVAAAANMQFAMEVIKTAFKAETGKDVKGVYGASGKLTAQIKNGAPFDVFVSADMSYPDSLFKWKYAIGKPKTYAYGILVLWTMKEYDLGKGLSILGDSSIAKIAIGDLKATIYGPAAVKAMTAANVYDAAKPKIVFGENITQVAQYITTQSADIGFNAKSIVLSPQMQGKGKWVEVDKSLYDPLAQGAVVLKYGQDNNPESSKAFYAFLYGKKAREILEKYGYILPEENR